MQFLESLLELPFSLPVLVYETELKSCLEEIKTMGQQDPRRYQLVREIDGLRRRLKDAKHAHSKNLWKITEPQMKAIELRAVDAARDLSAALNEIAELNGVLREHKAKVYKPEAPELVDALLSVRRVLAQCLGGSVPANAR